MNLLKQIKTHIENGTPVNQIKSSILEQDPQYNTYWVETEYVWYHLRIGKSVQQVSDSILENVNSFSGRWSIAKVQKFYNKLHNVQQTVSIRASSIKETILDEDRTFGIEIEFTYPRTASVDNLITALQNAGIPAEQLRVERMATYTNEWLFTSDCSVHVASQFAFEYCGSNELKSPILKGSDGIEQVRKVLKVLNSFNCKVNNSCGLHIHHGFKNSETPAKTILNACFLYHTYYNKIKAIMPKDRRRTSYAKNYSHNEIYSLRNLYPTVISDEGGNHLPFNFTSNRYKVVNVEAYSTHRTLEFRQHSATTDETKVVNWIMFTQRIMTTAQMFAEKKENLLNYSFGKMHSVLGLGSELVEYFEKRKEVLKVNGMMETEYHGWCQIHHSSGRGFSRRRRWR